jgi:single-stranded-DNA-specific exonuclease
MSTHTHSTAHSSIFSLPSVQGRPWRLRAADNYLAEALAQQYQLPEPLARLLAARKIGLDEAHDFLNPSLRGQMPDPSTLKDMDKAARRIADAIQQHEAIAIFGDYDVDGATSSALLRRLFRMLGVEPMVYIPDRMKEGYGPNAQAMESLHKAGCKLVITVDCGTVSFAPLAHAAALGLEVVVVDHHIGSAELPQAVAVVNPNRVDEENNLGHLAAVGVCFLLAVALVRTLRQDGFFNDRPEPDLLSLLDLVALGTVCDVVALTGLNRVYVAQGLKVLAKRQNIGLRALCDISRLEEAPAAWHLGFMIGPRINAGGRVGRASLGADILSCDDPVVAKAMAEELDRYNQERKAIEQMVLEEAMDQMGRGANANLPMLIAHQEGWHEGVIGIVAGRIKERYYRPSAVIAFHENGLGKASVRSIPGVDMGAAIHAALGAGLLEGGGGHAMAGGFTVHKDKLDALHQFFCDRIGAAVDAAGDSPPLWIDATAAPSAVTPELITMLEKAGPYGTAHHEPTIAIPNARIVQSSLLSGGEHLRLVVDSGTGPEGGYSPRLKAMAFRIADTPLAGMAGSLAGKRAHLAGKLRLNRWQGRESAEMLLDDLMILP